MKHNRSIPPATVIPVLVYPDVRAAVDWLSAAFGFAERVRIGESHRAQMSIGTDVAMIVADVRGTQQPPGANAVTHVMEHPVDRDYGERECTLEDREGRRWQFSETLRDVSPEEFGCQTVEPW